MSSKKINTFTSLPDTSKDEKSISLTSEKSIESILKNFKVSNRYEHLAEIGQGGMGKVTLARDKHSLRKVAIKTLNNDLLKNHEAVIRFSEEAQITAQLEHPNIIPVYELGIDSNNAPFYSMKYVRGTDLKEILKLIKSGNEIIKSKFHLTELLSIFIKVCDAMAYACSKGVLHRDLKPENIMIGEFGEVLVLDWGLAKTFTRTLEPEEYSSPEKLASKIDSFIEVNIDTLRSVKNIHLSMDNCLIGTPQYMPPERIIGDGDERSEVFTLGTILHDILALDNMYKGTEVKEVLQKITEGKNVPLSSLSNLPHTPGGKVPPALIAVVEKATHIETSKRYQNINELKSEIESFILGFATKAESAGFFRLLKLAASRNKKLSTLIVLMFVILIFISGVFIYELVHSRQNALNKSNYANFLKEAANRKTQLVEIKSKELKDKIEELKKHSGILLENARHEADYLNYGKALESIQQAIDLDPEKSLYYLYKGKILLALQEFDQAIETLEMLKPGFKEYVVTQDYLELSKELSNKIKKGKYGENDTLRLYRFFKEKKDYAEAIAVLKELKEHQEYDKFLTAIWKLKLMETKLSKALSSEKTVFEARNGMFTVSFREAGIYDLTPLAPMPIRELNLSNCRISTLLPLKFMPLEKLTLSNLKIKDLTPIKDLKLRDFRIRNCPVSDISPLKNMKLEFISINNCPVSKLDALTEMKLEKVELDHTLVSSLGPLRNQPIRYLSANNTRIRNLVPLRGMPLKFLMLNSTSINDIGALEKLKLEKLELNETFVSHVKKLNLSILEDITMSGTPLKNIDFLKGAKKLRSVGLSSTQITTLEPLRGQKLVRVFVENNAIKDLGPIANTDLNELHMSNSFSNNLTPLKNCRKLEVLLAFNCGISNIKPLKGLPLKRVNLSGNPQLVEFTHLTTDYLEELNIKQTGVKDLSFLKNSPLTDLIIEATDVQDISVLKSTINLRMLNMRACQRIKSVVPLLNLEKLTHLYAFRYLPDLYILKDHPSIKFLKIDAVERTLGVTWNIYDSKYFPKRIILDKTLQ